MLRAFRHRSCATLPRPFGWTDPQQRGAAGTGFSGLDSVTGGSSEAGERRAEAAGGLCPVKGFLFCKSRAHWLGAARRAWRVGREENERWHMTKHRA
jgi:hypothetical protein